MCGTAGKSNAAVFFQVEARLRQLEGKLLGSESAQPRGKAEPQKYDAARQGTAGALLTAPKAYNADTDVVMEPAKAEKKKVGIPLVTSLTNFATCVMPFAWCSQQP